MASHGSYYGGIPAYKIDPLYKTIGMGTRIFLAGAQGYVSWMGTQFNSGGARDDKGYPLGGAGTLAVMGEMREMNTKYIQPAVFERYGVSMFVGIGIPMISSHRHTITP